MPLKQVEELAERGLVRHRLAAQVDAHESAHRERAIQRFFYPRVQQIEPLSQEVGLQHPTRPARPASGPCRGLDIPAQSTRTIHTTTRPIFAGNAARRDGLLERLNSAAANAACRNVQGPRLS